MMDNQPEVISFLEGIKNCLYGDLENFYRLCREAEEKEADQKSIPNNKDENEEVKSITTTTQTTSSKFSGNSFSSNFNARSTIPHVLAVFSTIDLIGFLLGDSEVKADSQKYICTFLSLQEKEINEEYITQDFYKKLAIIYRNGIAHSFFPKNKFGISADSKNPDKLFFSEDQTEVLNVNYLINLTKQLFDKVLLDTSKFSNMEKQYKKILEKDANLMKDLKPLD